VVVRTFALHVGGSCLSSSWVAWQVFYGFSSIYAGRFVDNIIISSVGYYPPRVFCHTAYCVTFDVMMLKSFLCML